MQFLNRLESDWLKFRTNKNGLVNNRIDKRHITIPIYENVVYLIKQKKKLIQFIDNNDIIIIIKRLVAYIKCGVIANKYTSFHVEADS